MSVTYPADVVEQAKLRNMDPPLYYATLLVVSQQFEEFRRDLVRFGWKPEMSPLYFVQEILVEVSQKKRTTKRKPVDEHSLPGIAVNGKHHGRKVNGHSFTPNYAKR